MDDLVLLLSDIVSAEYAQWMRYTYLSALGHGLDTNQLSKHFKEHAGDELEHAELISRWIVDLGGVPPTDMPYVEQFHGSTSDAIRWLTDAEITGAQLYTVAHELAVGMPGLQNDISDILSTEHEHMSDLLKLCDTSADSGMNVIVVAYKKIANSRYFIRHARETFKTSQYIPAENMEEYIGEMLHMAWSKFGYDYTPEMGRQYIADTVEETVRKLWSSREDGDVKDTLSFYANLYKWITTNQSIDGWEQLHNTILWPDYKEWIADATHDEDVVEDGQEYNEDDYNESGYKKETVEDEKEEFEQILQQIEPSKDRPAKEEAPAEAKPEYRRPIEEPIEEALPGAPDSVIVGTEDGKGAVGVSVGDKVFNRTHAQYYEGPPRNKNKSSIGTIKEILPDDAIIVENMVGEEHTWQPKDDDIRVSLR